MWVPHTGMIQVTSPTLHDWIWQHASQTLCWNDPVPSPYQSTGPSYLAPTNLEIWQ